MSDPFKYNPDARYQVRPSEEAQYTNDPSSLHVVVQADGTGFEAKFPAAYLQSYVIHKVTKQEVVERWRTGDGMSFYQNQVNFAVWASTFGCGVSTQDHLNIKQPLMRAVYRFHFYYTVRRILAELQAPLPGDTAFDALDNPYDHRAYGRLTDEFKVSNSSDWRVKKELGIVHLKGVRREYSHRSPSTYHPEQHTEEWTAEAYDPGTMTFKAEEAPSLTQGVFTNHYYPPKLHHVEYVEQDGKLKRAWAHFILEESQGLTQAGVERINDSVRTYVWALLGAQSQTRASVLGQDGKAFDAQKDFLALVEDATPSPVDIGKAIRRYQDVLRYAGSSVNYSFGQGLYMSPSDMELRVGQIAGYNNEIVIAGPTVALGINTGLNQGTVPTEAHAVAPPPAAKKAPVGASEATTQHNSAAIASTEQHNDEKTAVIVGGVAIGLLALWLFG